MLKYRFLSLLLASLAGLSACGGKEDRTPDIQEPEALPRVIFNPALRQVPLPSDFQFASEALSDGTMSAGYDPDNPVITGIDSLDGNSVLAPFDIAFSEAIDDTQTLDAASFVVVEGGNVIPNPNQNVFLLPLEYPSGDGLSQANIEGRSVEIPTFAEAIAYQTAVAQVQSGDPGAMAAGSATLGELASPTARAEIISLDGGTNNILRINPLEPLQPKTKYLVIVTNVDAASGSPFLASEAYLNLKDESISFGEALEPVALAIRGWETLAAGYLTNFMQAVYDQADLPLSAPSPSEVIFSMTFTTGGTHDVLQSIAAPEVFFAGATRSALKKQAIVKLVSGTYLLDGTAADGASANDAVVAATLNALLTSETLNEQPNPLYNIEIAGAIAAGADYATIASSASAAFLMQKAATEAILAVEETDGVTIAQAASAQVQGIVAGLSAQVGVELAVSDVFPVPAPRSSNFYTTLSSNSLLGPDAAPGAIHEGEITLPYYQTEPTETDLSPVKTSDWEADTTIGAVIDAGSGNPAGTTPPSDKITYRYPFPAKQSEVTVPLLVTTPFEGPLGVDLAIEKPENGWPVIIYVHGLGTERSTSLPMANALSFACIARDQSGNPVGLSGAPCFATVAIDQPLHGIAPAGSLVPGLTSVNDPDTPPAGASEALTERHFNVTADAAANPIPMDYAADTGGSGTLFLNLTSFSTVRDNLRQMSVDLMNLNASLGTMDVDGDGEPDFDTSRVYFIGHSLGGINGLPFVAINNSLATQNSAFSDLPKIQAAAGLLSGGGIARLIENSQAYAPRVLGGLALASEELQQGRSGLETYFSVFQGVLDSADVTNFASLLSDGNSDTGVLLTELVGDDDTPSDGTIPIAADPIWDPWGLEPLNTTVSDTGLMISSLPAPLAGTEPMVAEFGATPTSAGNSDDGDPAVLITRFTDGTHNTPITGAASEDTEEQAVFFEMVSQLATFFALEGNVPGSIVTDTSVVAE